MKREMLRKVNSFFSVSPKYIIIITIIVGLLLGILQLELLYLIPVVIFLILVLRLNTIALLLGLLVSYKSPLIEPIPFFVKQSYFYKNLLAAFIVAVIFLWLFRRINKVKDAKSQVFFRKSKKSREKSSLHLFSMAYKRKYIEAEKRFVFYDSTSYRWVLFKVFIFTFLVVFSISISWSTISLSVNPLANIDNNPYKINSHKIDNVFAFYLSKDESSKDSLMEYGKSLDVLIPDWYSFDEKLKLKSNVELDVDKLAKDYRIKEMPLVSNLLDEGLNIDKINNANIRASIIDKLYSQVRKNKYKGITIDFRIEKTDNEQILFSFMSDLYKKFNDGDKKVAYVVSSKTSFLNSNKFTSLSDYIIVKLYNEPNQISNTSSIASQKWINDTLKDKNFPYKKLVVCFANYGCELDENSGQVYSKLTFNEVMKLCNEKNLKVYWNENFNNPYIKFDNGTEKHIVYFLDAATLYNQLNILSETKIKNVAIWPLGYEDSEIWNILKGGKKESIDKFKVIEGSENVNFIGTGQLLRVSAAKKEGLRDFTFDNKGFIKNEKYNRFPSQMKVERYGKSQNKTVILTFDDGPDPKYTTQILDILDKYKVKASFFIIGKSAERNPEIVQDIFDRGHEIGNHTFSHADLEKATPNEIEVELNANQRVLQEITGHSTVLFRTPYSPNVELLSENYLKNILKAQQMGYITVAGSVIDPYDWSDLNSEEIIRSVMKQLPLGNVILLHDGGGDRSNTVKALPKIIENLRSRGYTFTTISQLVEKNKDDIMLKVNENKDVSYDILLSKLVAYLKYGAVGVLTLGTILVILRLFLILRFSIKNKLKNRNEFADSYSPFVSVIVPAYNEQNVICKTIYSVLESDYGYFEVIVVNDGSADLTRNVVNDAFKGFDNVRIITKENGGKSSAINLGIQNARGEIIITVDADTVIDSRAIRKMVRHFINPEVAAVGGNIKVGNVNNALTIWQYIEYIIGFNFDKRAYDELNCITVVPGALGAWRKKVVIDAGYFDDDTLAEDTEMTIRLLKKGHKITMEEDAYCYTEAPQDVKSLLKQRYRWTYGTMQCIWKHRDAIFNKKHKALGFFALPSMVVFQYIFYPIAAITELVFYISLLNGWTGGNNLIVLMIYLSLILTSFAVAVYSFILEKVNFKYLLWVIPMYIVYRMLIAGVVIKSIVFSIKGEIIGWNKLKREGNVVGKGLT